MSMADINRILQAGEYLARKIQFLVKKLVIVAWIVVSNKPASHFG